MEVDVQRAQAAKNCFDFNKKVDTVHVTADLTCFARRTDAVNHARDLSDKTIDVFDRVAATEDAEFNEAESDTETDEAEETDMRSIVVKAGGSKRKVVKKTASAQVTPASSSAIIDKLNHLVDEVEGALGLNDTKTTAQ